MIRYAESKELILDIAAYMFPTLRKTIKQENVKDRFTPQEAGYYCMKAGLLQYGEEAFLQFLKQENPKIPADQECRELEGEKMRCRGGRSSFWITWDGKMTGCGMMDRPFVYPMKEGFSQAWRNLQKKIDEIRLPVSCATCDKKEECGLCAAMVLAETDGFSEVPVYRCRMLDSYQENCRSMKNKLEKKKC